jgi:tetratricopeptide (TPR) repeat protein
MNMQPPPPTESANSGKTIWVFTPSRTDPKDLEFILVQRQSLLQDAVERVRESALTDHKHHLLFVGPRGCGKTHLATLIVSRLAEDETLTDHLRIAWLNEDETCTTLLEFLLKIHTALEKRYPAEFSEARLSAAYEMKPSAALEFISQHLLTTLSTRTLLVVTENLDAIFEGLGDSGQKQLRSFIQENPRLSIVATAQRLVEDLSNRNSPFFGFFQTEHLKPLTVEQATELLQNIARLQNKKGVVEFLATSRGRSRVRAIHHLSGGNHRIYIVLSQFITRDSVDALLEPFMKMVDELTPYYQERIRWLPPLQRKIVEYLCTCEGTVPVKEIAKRLFATPQTISSQLQDLREKGYVEANQRGRESLYEITEPLMRICVEVKDNQRLQPLRLLVDFLRVWYDDQDLKNRLGKLESSAAACSYLQSAILRNSSEGNLRQHILLENLANSFSGKIAAADRDTLTTTAAQLPENAVLALQYWAEGKATEAQACIQEELAAATNQESKESLLREVSQMLIRRGLTHGEAGETQLEIADYTAVINLPNAPVDQVAKALYNRGVTHGEAGETQLEIADYTAAINLPNAPVDRVANALFNRGFSNGQAGETQLEIADYTSVINLPDAPVEQVAKALFCRSMTHRRAGETQLAIADYTAVISLPRASVEQVAMALGMRSVAYIQAGDPKRAVTDLTAFINLHGAPVNLFTKMLFIRGLIQHQAGETQLAIHDYTSLINLPSAMIEDVAEGLYWRGFAHLQNSQKVESQSDFETLTRLPEAPDSKVIDAYLALAELHFSEGRWSEGFQSLEASLERGTKAQPPHHETATDLVDVIFSAGLNLEGRRDKITELLRLYQKHEALPVLGESVIQHIGNVFRSGEPFPSSDNLESWKSAWEQAAESVPDFRLSLRLLSTSIAFLKAGGKDRTILLDLASAERSIVEQAMGIRQEPS